MEQKLVRVPFEVELAKRIQNGEINGRVVTRDGDSVRILCWDKKDKTYPIAAFVDNGDEEDFKTYTNEGVWNTDKTCTLKKYDLFLEIPEYMTFKDGDVYTTSTGSIGIYNSNYNTLCNSMPFYVGKRYDGELIFRKKDDYAGFGSKTESVLSTEAEKQKLINALKESKVPKAKEYLKRFFGIEVKQEYEFKPFDKVLVRQCSEDRWEAMLFSNYTDKIHKYRCCGMNYMHCIPYNDQTAHLLGTTDNWEE